MNQLKAETRTAIVLITHDLGLIAEMAARVVIMYAGQVIEEAKVKDIFREPLHPYTIGLLGSVPVMGRKYASGRGLLYEIAGVVPGLLDMPQGCRFHPRCQKRLDICEAEPPPMLDKGHGRKVRCWLWN